MSNPRIARRTTVVALVAALSFAALLSGGPAKSAPASQTQAIADQAYVYGFPIVDMYRVMFAYFIYPKSPVFKVPFNKIYSESNVYTPADTTIQTPNSDTPYGYIGLDMRAEPLVVTMPPIGKNRYYSMQFIDQYTFNVGYAGTRTTGNGGSKILVTGPSWHGTAPSSITKVIRFDTQFGVVAIRTQLLGASDLDNVRKIQAGYAVEPLSAYVRTAAPPPAPVVRWIPALSATEERTSPAFFNVLAFVLQFAPTRSSEMTLRKDFASIGIVPGKTFDAGPQTSAYVAGMAAGQKTIDVARAHMTTTADLFGSPQKMGTNYLNRALGAQWGIFANDAAEATYLNYSKDSNGVPLDGAKNYSIRFAKGNLPPVNAFWSLTMYNLPKQLLVANPLKRYLINSPMLPTLKRDADGGLTLYVGNSSPGKGKESNWLPAPAGPFFILMRLYWPKESILDGEWKQPPLTIVRHVGLEKSSPSRAR